jgi:glycosyltransferase involved in cell wall biosynthesis
VTDGPPTVSIVVPTFRRPGALAATIAALLELEYPATRCEIVVVDDASDSASERIVRERADSAMPVTYRAQPNSGAATARNHGARIADGELLLFCDDDVLLAPNHLSLLGETRAAFSDALVNGTLRFSRQVEAELRGTPFGRYRLALDRQFQAEADGRPLGRDCFQADLLTACNLGVGRHQFWDLGGFDEAFPYAGAEDQALSLSASRSGTPLVRNHRIRVEHNDQTLTFRQFCTREEKSAQTFAVLVDRFPEQAARPLFARNCRISRHDKPMVAATKLAKAALSRRPVLAGLHRVVGILERRRVSEGLLRRGYRVVVGLHIFRGVRIASRRSTVTRTPTPSSHGRT